MFSTLLVIGGVLVGLLVLLALIVSLSERPTTRNTTTAGRDDSWVVDAGRPHPDAWSSMSNTSTSTANTSTGIRAIR